MAISQTRVQPRFTSFLIKLVREKPLGTVGAVVLLILIIVGVFAPWFAPYGIDDMDLKARLSGPSATHILGVDDLGRDLLSRIIFGARVSMLVGLLGTFIEMCVATLVGTISGFLGGITDICVQRFVDAWMCFPSLVVYMTIMSLLGPGLWTVIIVLGISRGISSSRVARSAVIGVKTNPYVEAARATGASNLGLFTRHILPNIMAPLIIIFSLGMGQMIISEAYLSFLGFGVPPTVPTWGNMLSNSGRKYMFIAPHLAIWPGLSLSIVVYGVTMLGDAVRDLLDPRLRGGLGRYGGAVKNKLKRLKISGSI